VVQKLDEIQVDVDRTADKLLSRPPAVLANDEHMAVQSSLESLSIKSDPGTQPYANIGAKTFELISRGALTTMTTTETETKPRVMSKKTYV
jgi:hypothetical protein